MTLNAIHVGISGFPAGSASVNKCIAVYQNLNKNKIQILAINNRAFHRQDVYFEIEKKGEVNGIEYIYTSPSPFKASSFKTRRISNFKGKFNEFFLLLKLSRNKKIDVMFFYPNGSFLWLLYYRVFSLIFNYPIISHYVEFRSAFSSRKSLLDKISDFLFDKYFIYLVDAILPISEFLIAHLKDLKCKKPILKVPPLTDFEMFHSVAKTETKDYFLYVGSAAYLEVVKLITKAFELTDDTAFELHLVINGNPSEMKVLFSLVEQNKKHERIKVFSKLKYEDLLSKYINSKANLIPLSKSVQDTARFPQKIAEYLASGNPIITTRNGEVPYYFKDGINALIAQDYSAEEIAKKMNYVIANPEQASLIGKEAYKLGLAHFDSNNFGKSINNLIRFLVTT